MNQQQLVSLVHDLMRALLGLQRGTLMPHPAKGPCFCDKATDDRIPWHSLQCNEIRKALESASKALAPEATPDNPSASIVSEQSSKQRRAWSDFPGHVITRTCNTEHGMDLLCAQDLLDQLQSAVKAAKGPSPEPSQLAAKLSATPPERDQNPAQELFLVQWRIPGYGGSSGYSLVQASNALEARRKWLRAECAGADSQIEAFPIIK